MNVEQADRVQRIATPIFMVLAVFLASLCSSTGCSGDVIEATGERSPERAPGRDPRPSGGGGEDEDGTSAASAGSTSRADADGSGDSADGTAGEESTSGSDDGSSSSMDSAGGETSSSTGEGSSDGGSSSSEDSGAAVSNHCDAACVGTDAQFDPNVTACICAPQCLNNDWCDLPDECLDGRCGLRCDPLDDDCPGGMVCGMMPWNADWACMWIGETP